ncbi:MAG: hypothetical protein HYY52_03520, partial [Candidatus Melainabacteria bacterium]|nr:hypothetical protein [Candidatus Melainabacteria bacterium]
MKKLFSIITILIFVINYCLVFDEAFAAKKKPKAKSGSTLTLKSRDGSNIIYGSVLNSKENEIKAKLSGKILTAIRKEGLENITVTLTKLANAGETSNIYTLNPSESLDLFGKFLVINLLASLTDVAGSTYTAGALPEGNYELSITAGDVTAKGQIEYAPPTVLVGNVTSDAGCSGGTQVVKDLSGSPLSRTVALANCTYFNEVPANRVDDTKKARKLLHQETTGDSTEPSADVPDAPPAEDNTPIAISEAIVTTEEGGIDTVKAPVELDPEQNGDVQYDINSSTTADVDNALLAGDEELIEEILQGEVDPTKLTEEEDIIGGIVGEIEEEDEDFRPDPSCGPKVIALLDSVSEKPTKEELLEFANKVIAAIEGDFKSCVPKFVSEKIVPAIKNKGDAALIAFAKEFIFHAEEMEGGPGGPDPERICPEIERGLAFLKGCKGRFCPPPPCFPEEIRKICPSLASFPVGKCQEGPKACGLKGPPPGFGPGGPGFGPGGPGFGPGGPGFGPGGPGFGPPGGEFAGPGFGPPPGFMRLAQQTSDEPEDGCIDFKPPEPPNFCAPCESDDDCHGPKAGDQDPNAECDLPTIACVTSSDFDGNEKKVCHLNGKPKDPYTCREFPGPDPAQQCFGPPPPFVCGIGPDGALESKANNYGRFDKRCCDFGPRFGPGGFGGPGGGPRFKVALQTTGDDGGLTGFCDEVMKQKCGPGGDPSLQDNRCSKTLEPCSNSGGFSGGPGFGPSEPGFGPSGPGFGPGGRPGRPGKPHRPVGDCIRQKLCEDVNSNFAQGELGKVLQDKYESIKQQCLSESNNQDQPGDEDFGTGFGMGFGPNTSGGQFGPGGFGPNTSGGQFGPGGFGPNTSGGQFG